MAGEVFRAEGSIGLNDRDLLAGLARAEQQVRSTVRRLDGLSFTIDGDVDLDTRDADKKIKQLENRSFVINGRADLDTSAAEAKIASLQGRRFKVKGDLDIDARQVDKTLNSALRKAKPKAKVQAEVDRTSLRNVTDAIRAGVRNVRATVKVDVDRSNLGRLRSFMAGVVGHFQSLRVEGERGISLLKRWSDAFANTTVNVGPFNASLKVLAASAIVLGPALFGLVSALTSLASVFSGGLLAALSVGAGAMGGFALAATGITLVAKPLIQNFEAASTVAKGYTNAIKEAGAGSIEAKKALDAARQVMGDVPESTVRAIGSIDELQKKFQELTSKSKPEFFNTVAEGVRTLEALMPQFAARTNEAFHSVAQGLRSFAQGLRTDEAKGILVGSNGIFGNFNKALPAIMHGLGQVGAFIGRVAQSGSRYIKPLATSFNEWATGIAKSVSESGKLNAVIDRLVGGFKAAWSVIKGFSGVIFQLLRGAFGPGVKFANDLGTSLQNLAKKMSTPEGQEKIGNWIENFNNTLKRVWGAIKPLISLFNSFVQAIGPIADAIALVVTPIAKLVAALMSFGPTRGIVTGALAAIIGAFAVGKVLIFLSAIRNVIGALKTLATTRSLGAALDAFALGSAGRRGKKGPGGVVAPVPTPVGPDKNSPGKFKAFFSRIGGMAKSAGLLIGSFLIGPILKRFPAIGAAFKGLGPRLGALFSGGFLAAVRSLPAKLAGILKFAKLPISPAGTALTVASVIPAAINRVKAVIEGFKKSTTEGIYQTFKNLPVVGLTTSLAEKLFGVNFRVHIQKNLDTAKGLWDKFKGAISGGRQVSPKLSTTQSPEAMRRALGARGPQTQTVQVKANTAPAQAAITALIRRTIPAKILRFLANANPVFAVLGRITKTRLANKVFQILTNPGPALAGLARVTAVKIATKIFQVVTNPAAAIASVGRVNILKIASKVFQILTNPAAALSAVGRVNSIKIAMKNFAIRAIDQASRVIGAIKGLLSSLKDKIVNVFVNRQDRGAQGGIFARGGVTDASSYDRKGYTQAYNAAAKEGADQDRRSLVSQRASSTISTGGGNPSAGRPTKGEVVRRPTFLTGEEGRPEVVIASNPAYRERNVGLWEIAGKMLGVQGFARGGIPSGNRTASIGRPGLAAGSISHTPVKFGPGGQIVYPAKHPTLVQLDGLMTQQKATDAQYTSASGAITEPENFIKEIGTGEDGETQYEVDKGAVNQYLAQLQSVRALLQKLMELNKQIMALVPVARRVVDQQIAYHKKHMSMFLTQASQAEAASRSTDARAAGASKGKASRYRQLAAAENKLITAYGSTKSDLAKEQEVQSDKSSEYSEQSKELDTKAQAVGERIAQAKSERGSSMGSASSAGSGKGSSGGASAGKEEKGGKGKKGGKKGKKGGKKGKGDKGGSGGDVGDKEKVDPAAKLKAEQQYGQDRYDLLAQYGSNISPLFLAGPTQESPASFTPGPITSPTGGSVSSGESKDNERKKKNRKKGKKGKKGGDGKGKRGKKKKKGKKGGGGDDDEGGSGVQISAQESSYEGPANFLARASVTPGIAPFMSSGSPGMVGTGYSSGRKTVNIVNNFSAGPSDPHTWAAQQAWETRMASI